MKDIALLPNGKIVAVGSGRMPFLNTPLSRTSLFIVRYNSDGTLDTTFNSGGKYTSSAGGVTTEAEAVAVQADGKFIVAGHGGGQYDGNVPDKILLLRFADSGIDTAFGSSGTVLTQVENGQAAAYSIAVQPDGKLVVGGRANSGSNYGLSLARYDANGNLDTSFGSGGLLIVNSSGAFQAADLLIQPDGKIIAVSNKSGNSNNSNDFVVLRFAADGAPDATFGTNGTVVTDVSGVADSAFAAVLQTDGKIIVAGSSYDSANTVNVNPALVRYNSNGTLDAAFGIGGIVRTPAGFPLNDIALQSDGKILAASKNLRVVRYRGDAPFNARPTAFDFDGDGWADFSVTRDTGGHLNWYAIENPSNEFLIDTEWGESADKRVSADYDGDRKSDVAVFRPRDGVWYIIKSSDNTVTTVRFGQSGDQPIAADFDGDGRADTAVFRGGTWYILNSSNGGFRTEQFGTVGDQPLTADFDGDGRADLAVYRRGVWYIQQSSAGFFAANFGLADDVTTPADYDGDGKTDLAVFRPSTGTWYLQQSTAGFDGIRFGQNGDAPVAADYDGDGKTDIAVYRAGIWYVRGANGGLRIVYFGQSDDQPVPAKF